MGDQIAAYGDKPCAGGRFAHGLQTGVEERIGRVNSARMAVLLQRSKTLLLVRRRRRGENGLPRAHRRGNQLRNFGRIPKRLEVNVAEQERGNGCFGCVAALGWRFEQNWIRCGGRATLRKSRAGAQKKASQRDVPSGNFAEDAGCEITFHRNSLTHAHSNMSLFEEDEWMLGFVVTHPSSPQRQRPVVGNPEVATTKTRRGRGTHFLGTIHILVTVKEL